MGYLTVAKGPHDFYGDPLSKAKPEGEAGRIFAQYDPKKSKSPKYGKPGGPTVDKGVALGQKSGNKAAAKATFKGHSGGGIAGVKGHMSDSFEKTLDSIMERVFFSPTKFHKIGNVPGGRTWPQYESGKNGKSKGATKVVYDTPENSGTKKEDVGANMSPIGTKRNPGETEGGQPPAQFIQGGEGRRNSHESFDRKLENGLNKIIEDEFRVGGPAGAGPLNRKPREIEPIMGPGTFHDIIDQVLNAIDSIIEGDVSINKRLEDVKLEDFPFYSHSEAYRDLSSIFQMDVGGDTLVIEIAIALFNSENDI